MNDIKIVLDEVQVEINKVFDTIEKRVDHASSVISTAIIKVAEAVLEPEDALMFLNTLDEYFEEENNKLEKERDLSDA